MPQSGVTRMKRLFTRKKLLLGLVTLSMVVAFVASGLFSTAATCIDCAFRLRTGMSLNEAESVLGRADKELDGEGVVWGDEFYHWHKHGVEIHIGVQDGTVCDTWFGVEFCP
jgi:hypothetical protein